MKKELTIAITILALTATPVLAAHDNNGNNNGNGRDNADSAHTNHVNNNVQNTTVNQSAETDNDTQNAIPTTIPTNNPTVTPSTSPCDPDAHWKNHGAFISCIAHLHQGGEEVSEAAHSEIGKSNEPSEELTPSVSPSPSATPSVSPTVTVSPTPISSAMDNLFEGNSPLKNLGTLVSRFVSFLIHLI